MARLGAAWRGAARHGEAWNAGRSFGAALQHQSRQEGPF